MKKQYFLLPALCLFLVACENRSNPASENRARNVRDNSNEQLHRDNLFEKESDQELAQKIRQTLLDDASFSENAKNIKITTINGVVTLRGIVNSENEKSQIARKVKMLNGVKNVDNQLEVTTSNTSSSLRDSRF